VVSVVKCLVLADGAIGAGGVPPGVPLTWQVTWQVLQKQRMPPVVLTWQTATLTAWLSRRCLRLGRLKQRNKLQACSPETATR